MGRSFPNNAVFVLCLAFVYFGQQNVEATLCTPHTKFKIDCMNCYCSEDGSEYFCDKALCGKEREPEQHDFRFADDEYVLPAHKENRMPYINDEIPPPFKPDASPIQDWEDMDEREDDGQANQEDFILPANNDNNYETDDERFAQRIQDVGLDEQLDVDEMDGGLPDDFRFKRDIVI